MPDVGNHLCLFVMIGMELCMVDSAPLTWWLLHKSIIVFIHSQICAWFLLICWLWLLAIAEQKHQNKSLILLYSFVVVALVERDKMECPKAISGRPELRRMERSSSWPRPHNVHCNNMHIKWVQESIPMHTYSTHLLLQHNDCSLFPPNSNNNIHRCP